MAAGQVEQFDPRARPTIRPGRVDLDCAENIDSFVRLFYERLLADPLLAPVFLDEAEIDLEKHLPLISLYWQKMLLGDDRYQRNTMEKHRQLHRRSPLRGEHHERWLAHFMAVMEENFSGPYAARARQIAGRVMSNLYHQLHGDQPFPGAAQQQ